MRRRRRTGERLVELVGRRPPWSSKVSPCFSEVPAKVATSTHWGAAVVVGASVVVRVSLVVGAVVDGTTVLVSAILVDGSGAVDTCSTGSGSETSAPRTNTPTTTHVTTCAQVGHPELPPHFAEFLHVEGDQ
jgi:hypothetical protein